MIAAELDIGPNLPPKTDYGIGCIGAGFIMRDCHLVAYRSSGFNPVAIASRKVETATEVAKQHGIPKVHSTIDDLLNDAAIEVLDVAVPPDALPDRLRTAGFHDVDVKVGMGRQRWCAVKP